jgi:phosphoribosylformylglycinamidine synthase
MQRVFVEKRTDFAVEAQGLRADLARFLGPQYPALAGLRELRLLNRYDLDHLDAAQCRQAVELVLAEPQRDRVFFGPSLALALGETLEPEDRYFTIEYLRGQYDQRADSAAQCIELVAGVRPAVRTGRAYVLRGSAGPVPEEAVEAVKRYLINPVDSREAADTLPESLEEGETAIAGTPVLSGFCQASGEALREIRRNYDFAMTGEDLRFCQTYFQAEGRDPSLAELRVLDTYWSDHCRHTTFITVLETIEVCAEVPDERSGEAQALRSALGRYEAARRELYGPAVADHKQTLMDMATIGGRLLKKRGLLPDLDDSPEINACTIKVRAEFEDGTSEPWLLLFKNETHNHPTEIEPFGGAATCLGGAIRDPLAGRAYVYQAMRISGGADPRQGLAETLPGKLPQLRLAREAAAGYASYGNQIGIPAGQVAEFYHPGFLAKRMELGAVIAAVPEAWVRREEPADGDAVILAGGKTGRDGIGGATGSSMSHTRESVEKSGAQVQKGNAVEERKLQRLFRNPEALRLMKRCNDFGAGGVAVALGELAAGLDIDLDRLPKKYAGLNGIELAISESQERMALVVAPDQVEALIRLAERENLSAVIIARIRGGGDARLRMFWQGRLLVDLDRALLNTNGVARFAKALIRLPVAAGGAGEPAAGAASPGALLAKLQEEIGSLRSGSRRGLQERFDGSVGAASALFPWGGRTQGTPECGMAALLPSREKESRTASIMTFGYNPELAEYSPYLGAKGAVREALAKFACVGGNFQEARLSLQEYFERLETPQAWGTAAAALLGALEAQLALGIPAIGGKDSMSGTYQGFDASHRELRLAVPPTLAAFAAGTAPASSIRSGALSGVPGNLLILLPQTAAEEWECFTANMRALARLTQGGTVRAAYPVSAGGIGVSLALMAFGNMTGVEVYAPALGSWDSRWYQGSLIVETAVLADTAGLSGGIILGKTITEPCFRIIPEPPAGESAAACSLEALRRLYEGVLAQVYPQTAPAPSAPPPGFLETGGAPPPAPVFRRRTGRPAPLAVLPVFPGTNCEWDMERAFRRAGARVKLVVFRNRGGEEIKEAVGELAAAIKGAQIVALSGGFSAGDEPDGSGKFIANVFRAPAVADAVMELLSAQDGLILGICNGFQALIKLGLVPYGAYRQADAAMPFLTFNRIGRHVSRMVWTRIMPTRSPWFTLDPPGSVHSIPVSHGEGRLIINEEAARSLLRAGQIPCCYADSQGRLASGEPDNPNGSDFAIEALTSPDGRILGKMGHSERWGRYVHSNIPGNKQQRLFEAGVAYFQ